MAKKVSGRKGSFLVCAWLMNKIKLYSHEDLAIAVSRALKLRGFEAYTTIEQGNSNNTDEEQLACADAM